MQSDTGEPRSAAEAGGISLRKSKRLASFLIAASLAMAFSCPGYAQDSFRMTSVALDKGDFGKWKEGSLRTLDDTIEQISSFSRCMRASSGVADGRVCLTKQTTYSDQLIAIWIDNVVIELAKAFNAKWEGHFSTDYNTVSFGASIDSDLAAGEKLITGEIRQSGMRKFVSTIYNPDTFEDKRVQLKLGNSGVIFATFMLSKATGNPDLLKQLRPVNVKQSLGTPSAGDFTAEVASGRLWKRYAEAHAEMFDRDRASYMQMRNCIAISQTADDAATRCPGVKKLISG